MKREPTTAAQAAKLIRAELKKHFPDTKFKVKSDNFTGGDSVNITWTDGITTKRVEHIIGKYEEGKFNTTTDMYEYDNRRDDIPQVKFLQVRREISDIVFEEIKNYLEENEITLRVGSSAVYNGREHIDDRIYRIFNETNYS